MIKFQSLSSGSCGNCYLLILEQGDSAPQGIIIDAGVSLRRFKKELTENHYSPDNFHGILVTHDHVDHIRALGSYCKHLQKPVYATSTLHKALAHHTFTKDWISSCRRDLRGDQAWNELVPDTLFVRFFVVPHDATQTVGYGILLKDYRFVIMTDLGRVTPEAMAFARNADTVVIESNYDRDMLDQGPYTEELKRRISDGHGHLSNLECAEAIKAFWHPELKHIFLCHLSENNNTPELARETSLKALDELGFKPSYPQSGILEGPDGNSITLQALPRDRASVLFNL